MCSMEYIIKMFGNGAGELKGRWETLIGLRSPLKVKYGFIKGDIS